MWVPTLAPTTTPAATARAEGKFWRISTDVSVLEELANPSVNLVVWERSVPAHLQEELLVLASGDRVPVDTTFRADAFHVAPLVAGISADACAWLKSDLNALTARFCSLSGASLLRLFFGPVRTDQCRKFHVDFVHHRLVTTYVGPGTEWVPEEFVDRDALRHPIECPCDANARIVKPGGVRRAKAGDVVVMKGELNATTPGAVHRSPPIESLGLTRWVLILTALHS